MTSNYYIPARGRLDFDDGVDIFYKTFKVFVYKRLVIHDHINLARMNDEITQHFKPASHISFIAVLQARKDGVLIYFGPETIIKRSRKISSIDVSIQFKGNMSLSSV